MEQEAMQNSIDFEDPKIKDYVTKKIEEYEIQKIETQKQLEEAMRLKEISDNLTAEERKKFEELSKSTEKIIKDYEEKTRTLQNQLISKEVSEVMLEKGIDKGFKEFLTGSNRAEIEQRADMLLRTIAERDERIKQQKYKNIEIPKVDVDNKTQDEGRFIKVSPKEFEKTL